MAFQDPKRWWGGGAQGPSGGGANAQRMWDEMPSSFEAGTGSVAGGPVNPPDSGVEDTSMTWAQAGMGMAAIATTLGVVLSAVSAFYGAKVRQEQLKAQASAFAFQAEMSAMNARRGEEQATRVMASAQFEKERAGLQAGQEIGAIRARTAGRGIVIGVGSAAEVVASRRVIYEIERRTINRNAVVQANAARRGAVNERIRGRMLTVGSANMRASADSINPWMRGGGAGLGGVSQAGAAWARFGSSF